MPTYEYACAACGHEWEVSQSMKDDPLKKCPACKKMKAQRQISGGGGFILKGGGWYSDLYASAKTTSGGDKGDASTSSTKTDVSTKSDTSTKSETKAKTDKASTKSGGSSGSAASSSD